MIYLFEKVCRYNKLFTFTKTIMTTTAIDTFTEILQKIENDYEKKRATVLAKKPTGKVGKPDGTMSIVKHYLPARGRNGRPIIKNGKEIMEEKRSAHFQVNPELQRLREEMYQKKSAAFKAYYAVVNA